MSGPIKSITVNKIYLSNPDDRSSFTEFSKDNLTNICFLKGTKILLSSKEKKDIDKLSLKDEILTYNIKGLSQLKNKTSISNYVSDNLEGEFSTSRIRNIWINPTDSYLIINNKLSITKHHLIHFRRENKYYFNYSENLKINDELLTHEGIYEKIETIEEVKENVNVYNFELMKDQTYFAEDYLVHHYCKLCSGYSNII